MAQSEQANTEGSGISRREFLETAGGAALAATLAAGLTAPVAAQDEAKPDRRVRMGIVGGGFGSAFHWHQDPGCVVHAVSDLRPDRRQHLQNVYRCGLAYESLEVMITDPDIDAIAVFSGAPDHVRHCVMVMEAGKHAISACPAAMTLEECEQLVRCKEETGMKYMMAETSYYQWPAILARRLWEDGVFGEIFYTEVEYYHDIFGQEVQSLMFFEGQRTWRYGFPPMHYPTHSLGFTVGVTRERMVEVSCLGWGDDNPTLKDNVYGNPFNNASALFKTDRGNICRCNVMWRIHASGERATWYGTNATMYMPNSGGQHFRLQVAGQPDLTEVPDYWHMVPEAMRYDSGHGSAHPFLTHEFVQAILEDREPAVDVYEAVAMTAPGIVAHQSALRGGEQMKIPSFDPVLT